MSTIYHQNGFLDEQVKQAPSWVISFCLHAVVLLVLFQVPFLRGAMESLQEITIRMPQPTQDVVQPPPVKPNLVMMAEFEPITDPNPADPSEIEDDPGNDTLDDEPEPEGPLDPLEPDMLAALEQALIAPPLIRGEAVAFREDRIKGLTGRGGPGGKGPGGNGGKDGGIAVQEAALIWLARAQEADGRWDSRKWGAIDNYDVGCTGLALSAFLALGHSDTEGPYRRNIYMALRWLERQQKAHGNTGNFGCPRFYGQGIATMACADAYGMGCSPWVGRMAQRGIDFIVATQPDDGGFDYTGAAGEHNDTSITGWQIMALKTGRLVGLDVPESAIEKSKRYLRESINPNGSTGYRKTARPGPAMTSVGLLCRLALSWNKNDPECRRALTCLLAEQPDLNDLYYCYYSAYALCIMGGSTWDAWRRPVYAELCKRQVKGQGPALDGSWDADTRWGRHAGRVYTTAMSSLVLAAEFRFPALIR